jgi:hypothetical protein
MDYDFSAAAWVPFAEGRALDDMVALGSSWLKQQVGDLRQTIIVKTAKHDGLGVAGVEHFPGITVTPKTKRQSGPAIVYVPSEDTLALGCQLANRSAICVIETLALPIRGWAMASQAVDLDHPDQPPAAVPDAVAKVLERIVFNGHNSWFPKSDRAIAVRLLQELADMEALDVGDLVGYMLARGKSADAVKQLRKLTERVHR